MSGNVEVNIDSLMAFAESLKQLEDKEKLFFEECTKELAMRLLRKVIKRTPVGVYNGDEYINRKGKKAYRKYKTVRFTTRKGEAVEFRAKINGRVGGTLRRGWTAKSQDEANQRVNVDVNTFIANTKIKKVGNSYAIMIFNPVEYASYVEYGHRTRDHKKWIDGRFMLTISEQEINMIKEGVLQKKLEEFLRRCFGD